MLKTLTVLLLAAGLQASPITYSVVVNTSSISGQSGNIDLQFNPGGGLTDPAKVVISAFSSNGTLAGAPATVGSVTGTLPSPVTFLNTTAFNDYFDGFTFGNTLSFLLTFDGTAINSPSGAATSGSSFALSLFNAAADAALLSTNADGFLVIGDVDTHGHVAISNFGERGTTTVAAVPEPAYSGLIAVALSGLAIAKFRSQIQAR